MFSRPGTTPRFSEGLDALVFGFSAFGLRTSRLDFFCDLAMILFLFRWRWIAGEGRYSGRDLL